ncbi:MAG TPA: pyridoxamine 5'-phosphate oxidase family protein [Candidatus Bathyarchaeia archaeon]|nr:pyridoxamine 5'-phosphate oxidase family protein [Candidatus Bathyarchaeia archaeon]
MKSVRITKRQKNLIEKGATALATSDLDNRPNVIVVACCKVVDRDKILITDNFMNKTRSNLLKNNRVAIAVWSKDWKEGYQFKGKVQYFTSGKWKRIVDEDPDNKELAHKAAVLVKVDEIWDLAEPKLIIKR